MLVTKKKKNTWGKGEILITHFLNSIKTKTENMGNNIRVIIITIVEILK